MELLGVKELELLVMEGTEEEYMEQKMEEEPFGDLVFMEFSSIEEMFEELEYQGFERAQIIALTHNRYGDVIELTRFKEADGSERIGMAIGGR